MKSVSHTMQRKNLGIKSLRYSSVKLSAEILKNGIWVPVHIILNYQPYPTMAIFHFLRMLRTPLSIVSISPIFGVVQNLRPCGWVFFRHTLFLSPIVIHKYMHTPRYILLPLLETCGYTMYHINACQTYSLPRYIIKCKIKNWKCR